MKVLLHSEASRELIDISEWYETREPGLGLDFILVFESIVSQIKSHPESGTQMNAIDRRMLFLQFPYGLIYSIESNEVVIYAIMHQSRKPEYWKSRRE